MKIAFISDSMTHYTGFGKQTRLIGQALFDRGHEFLNIAPMGLPWENQDFSVGPVEWGVEFFFDAKIALENVREYRPDVVVCFRDSGFLSKFNEHPDLFCNCSVFFWYADENECPSESQIAKTSAFKPSTVMPVSRSVERCLSYEVVKEVVYHGFDFDNIPDFKTKAELRNEWSEKLNRVIREDEVVIFCGERNDLRKNWEAVYAVVSGVSSRLGKPVTLVEVTSEHNQVLHFDRPACRDFYGIALHCVDVRATRPQISDLDVMELMKLSDLRLTCSGAEGFGLLTLEAAALEIPQVVNEVASYREILGDSDSIVPAIRTALNSSNVMYFGNKAYTIPNVDVMINRCVNMLTDDGFRESVVRGNFDHVRYTFALSRITDQMLRIFESSKPTPIPPRASTKANLNTVRALSYIFRHLAPGGTVVELGAIDSLLLSECVTRSLKPKGITYLDPDDKVRFTGRVGNRVVSLQSLGTGLPKADIFVIPDSIPGCLKTLQVSLEKFAEVIRDLCTFIVVRVNPTLDWDEEQVELSDVEATFSSVGLVRRVDLETIVNTAKLISLNDYQIWAKDTTKNFHNVRAFLEGASK